MLIAGGDSKDGDLAALGPSLERSVKHLVLIGKDAPIFKSLFEKSVPCQLANDLSEAVDLAQRVSAAGDTVLLSPACSSLDMFVNYQERGDQFRALVSAKGDGNADA